MRKPFCDDNLLQHIVCTIYQDVFRITVCCQSWAILRIYCVVHQEIHIRERTKEKKDSTLLLLRRSSKSYEKNFKTIAWLLTINMSVDVANISSFLFIICCLLSIEILFGFYEVWLNLFNLLLMEQKAWALQKTWLH